MFSNSDLIEYSKEFFYGTSYVSIASVLFIMSTFVVTTQYLFDKFIESMFGRFLALTYHEVIDLAIKTLVLIFTIKYFDNSIFPWI